MLVLVPGALAASAAAATGDSRYARANARLARTIPAYPRSKLLVEEPINGEVGSTGFEAVQRIYRSSHAITQRALNRFLARKLAAGWRPRGSTGSLYVSETSGGELLTTRLAEGTVRNSAA